MIRSGFSVWIKFRPSWPSPQSVTVCPACFRSVSASCRSVAVSSITTARATQRLPKLRRAAGVKNALICAANVVGSMGLAMYPWNPAFNTRSRSPTIA